MVREEEVQRGGWEKGRNEAAAKQGSERKGKERKEVVGSGKQCAVVFQHTLQSWYSLGAGGILPN